MSLKLPPVLAVQRGIIVTDGVMSSIVCDKQGNEHLEPIRVIRHGIRGINPATKKETANIQRTESAKTSPEAIGLAVEFSLRTIAAEQLLFSCSDIKYREALEAFIKRYFSRGVPEFEEVCRRYARNILNGRWLWRNRVLGEPTIEAKVGEKTYTGAESRIGDFNDYTQDEKNLADDVIATGLIGSARISTTVTGRIHFGFQGEVEVFPSQNMVTGKPAGFARSLYKVNMITRKEMLSIMASRHKDGEGAEEFAADMIDMGRAALRDQKIANAIRTIDTWYPKCDGTPIPIEPNGANLEKNVLFRDDPDSEAEHLLSVIDEMQPGGEPDWRAAYLIALLVRGGVFSESSKKDSEAT